MGFKDNDSCLKNAAPDEPIFVLRAQDKFATTLLIIWAILVESEKGVSPKTREARAIAKDMVIWQNKNGSKTPD